MNKLSVRDIEVGGRRVLVRVDFNVPLSVTSGGITDDSRIQAAMPTIDYLIDKGARVILCSHLGRPGGRVVEELRLGAVARHLSELLRQGVKYTADSIGAEVEETVASLKAGDVMLLENLRFHAGEEENSPAYAAALARLADVYVDDAFATAHRSHASIVGVAGHLPAVAGLLLQKELTSLGRILEDPAHPFGVLLGGAKTSDKAAMLANIMDKVNCVLIGGGMAATFLKASGYEVGLSSVKDDPQVAIGLIAKAARNRVQLILPEDVLVAGEDGAGVENVSAANIPVDKKIVDIGWQAITSFTRVLERCRTVFWNGPMGIYEIDQYAEGTKAMAGVIAGLNAATIIGGGSTAEIVIELKLADKMSFVSTGGGASLRFLSGEGLPGVDVILEKMPSAVKNG
jgi:phosphoglycerate kinase